VGRFGLVHLTHLGLPVLEADRSLDFYSTYFGFDRATAQRYPDGTVIIRNADGFDLALHVGQDPGAPQPFMHDAGGVSFKCVDPDGHRVEVYWEA
jgi:catechol 2,3-dioxygenase-like lactoylglutathione lyase family enzyme